MNSAEALVTFIIVSFCLAAVIIMRREQIPPPLRRFLALSTLIMVSTSFILLVYTFFTAGN